MYEKALYPATQNALAILGQKSFLQEFYLAGGTAAALHLGHRRSVDLDFFSKNPFDGEWIIQSLAQIDEVEILKKEPKTLIGYWKQTRLEFFEYPYKLLEKPQMWLGIKIAGLRDIALMKMIAIANRGSKKDFFDLYEICKRGISLQELFKLLPLKFHQVKYDTYSLLKSLVYFENAENEPDPDLINGSSWENVKAFFLKEAKTIEI